MPAPKTAVRNKLRKMADTIAELRTASNPYFAINITRLTSVKSLCDTHGAAKQFVMFLARRTMEKMVESPCPRYKEPEEWERIKAFALDIFRQLQAALDHPGAEQDQEVCALKQQVYAFQNTHQPGKYGEVRIIRSSDVLLLEYVLECIASADQYGTWAYAAARQYAERYAPSRGTGLIPESIPMLEDMLDFWHRYYYASETA